MNKIMNKVKDDPFRYSFYICGIILILIFLLSVIFTHGDSIKHYLFTDQKDTFMDFFNSMYDTIGRRPYERGVIYPPLCYVIYYILLRTIPLEQLSFGSPEFKTLQAPVLAFAFYEIISMVIFIICLIKMKKGKNSEKILFISLILMSVPFMFAFERGNIIFVALIFLMIFICFKDSKNKVLRELSLISLAASASIKIYPAIFGLLLVKEKRWKEIIRVIIYGLILFIVPFIFFGGFSEIKVFINNLTSTTDEFSVTHIINRLNFTASIEELCRIFNISDYEIFSKFIVVILFILSIINSLFSKENWKTYALLSCLIVGIPGISFTYTGIFFIIPFLYAIDEPKKRNIIDYIYLILFILIFFPSPLGLLEEGSFNYFYNNVTLNTKIMSISILFLTILLNVEGIINIIKNIKNRKRIMEGKN